MAVCPYVRDLPAEIGFFAQLSFLHAGGSRDNEWAIVGDDENELHLFPGQKNLNF